MPVGRALQWPSGVSKKEAQVWGCEYSTPSLEGGGAKKMLARLGGGDGGGGGGGGEGALGSRDLAVRG